MYFASLSECEAKSSLPYPKSFVNVPHLVKVLKRNYAPQMLFTHTLPHPSHSSQEKSVGVCVERRCFSQSINYSHTNIALYFCIHLNKLIINRLPKGLENSNSFLFFAKRGNQSTGSFHLIKLLK
jgi:hypothetical protein